MDTVEIQEQLIKILNPHRYEHTMGVAYTSACMAMRYGVDMKQAFLAGLLHDNAKCIEDEEMLARCRKLDIPISPVEERSAYLLHAKLGAYYAKERYGVDDEEVLNAISFHTTGRPAMTTLEKIVFTADYLEPNRRMIEGLPKIREEVFIDLDETVYMILHNTLSYLKSKSKDGMKSIDENTVHAYEYYKEIHEKNKQN